MNQAEKLEVRQRGARILHQLAPWFGACYRCKMPWLFVDGHSTPYTELNSMFPLCEKCWRELTPESRMPYYRELWESWKAYGCNDVRWEDIRRAVESGK